MDMFRAAGGWEAIAAAILATVVAFVLLRCLTGPNNQRYALPIALFTALVTGFWMREIEWPPRRNFHFVPYWTMLALVVGPISVARGLALLERWIVVLLVAIGSAWFIVPTWATLQPSRTAWIVVLSAAIALLAVLLERLPKRVGSTTTLVQLAITSATIAAVVLATAASTYVAPILVFTGALAGCAAAAFVSPKGTAADSVVLAYAVVAAGTALLGCVEPRTPQPLVLAIPVAPLSLWLFVGGPLAKLKGWKCSIVQCMVTVLIAGSIAGFLLAPGLP